MNNNITKIIFLSIIALFFICVLVLLLLDTDFLFSNYKNSVLMDENYNLEKVERINIDSDSSDILIKESEEETIRVIIEGKSNDKYSILKEKNELNITKEGSSCFGFCFMNDKVTVYLPKSYNKDIEIKSKSSDIKVEHNFNFNLKINTISGDINTKSINNISVKTTSGDIQISEGNNIELNSVSGDVQIDKCNNANIETTSGDITINELNLEKNGYIKSTSGDVNINNINNVYIETTTISGDTKISSNNRHSDIELIIKTTSGDINVK